MHCISAFLSYLGIDNGALSEPGGYLQWGEVDVASWQIIKSKPENKINALALLKESTQIQDPRLRPTWIPKLGQHLAEAGFVDVEADVRDAKSNSAFAMHECNLIMHELIPQKTGDEKAAQKIKNIMPEICKETKDGACYVFSRWIVVGRKPEA